MALNFEKNYQRKPLNKLEKYCLIDLKPVFILLYRENKENVY